MNYDDFIEKYKPIQNHIDKNACREGMMFKTYDEELMYVINHGLDHNRTIWTIVDIYPEEEYNKHGEPNISTAIIAGYHYVNRHGYFITEKPFEEHEENIEVIDN